PTWFPAAAGETRHTNPAGGRREWLGDRKRTWNQPEDLRRQAGGCEASTRHRLSGQDRDRPTARRDCGYVGSPKLTHPQRLAAGWAMVRIRVATICRIRAGSSGLPPWVKNMWWAEASRVNASVWVSASAATRPCSF